MGIFLRALSMKKIFITIVIGILIVVSLVAIGVSFSDLSKNEEQNKALATQIKQNVELKERLVEIEHTIVAYDEKTNELNKINERLGIEEARLQDEETELKKIKEERDKESEGIDSEEKKLNKEFLRLQKVKGNLIQTKKKLDDDERKWKEKNESPVKNPTGEQPSGDQSTGTSEKEEMPKELKDRKAQFNKDNDKYKNDIEKYKQDRQKLQNYKDEYRIKMDNYNERLRRYNDDCLEFNPKKRTFDAENSEHNGKADEIKKLKNEKLEIENKISSFEKENPNIQAKYNEFQQTKSYLTMIIVVCSSLLFVLIIALIFVLVFKRKNKTQHPKIRTTRNYDFSPSFRTDKLKIEEHEDKQLLNRLEAVFSKIEGISSNLADLDRRLKKLEENKASNISTKHNEKIITQPIKNTDFEERLKQLEEKIEKIESIFDYEDETQKNDCEEEKS